MLSGERGYVLLLFFLSLAALGFTVRPSYSHVANRSEVPLVTVAGCG